jgi:hypothetical protein
MADYAGGAICDKVDELIPDLNIFLEEEIQFINYGIGVKWLFTLPLTILSLGSGDWLSFVVLVLIYLSGIIFFGYYGNNRKNQFMFIVLLAWVPISKPSLKSSYTALFDLAIHQKGDEILQNYQTLAERKIALVIFASSCWRTSMCISLKRIRDVSHLIK